ncbi:MAG TPA: KpsF/GutQ family sugar-phosphate isomerase [Gemmatimonadota bacterium]|nr:KpsF/GutQ family sugar-phosphate isomerase [Gemmatimonadota bacterium]
MAEAPAPSTTTDERLIERAREVLRIESASVAALEGRIGPEFLAAVRLIHGLEGRLVVSGMGKSGGVARKLASTFSSTGTPALFLHPAEGMHGDIGVLVRGDALLAISKSGESPELAQLLPTVNRLGLPIVAMTAGGTSHLAREADIVLDVGVDVEACPHDLAPTASSTAALAMGDALAMALVELRQFGPEDFARLHPGGELGRRLTWRVRDVMLTDPDVVPRLGPDDALDRATHEIAHKRGTVPVIDEDGRLIGVITAGDLTRFAADHPDFMRRPVRDAMNPDPYRVDEETMATEALASLRRHGIMALPVVDADGRLRGIVHLHDMLRAGFA